MTGYGLEDRVIVVWLLAAATTYVFTETFRPALESIQLSGSKAAGMCGWPLEVHGCAPPFAHCLHVTVVNWAQEKQYGDIQISHSGSHELTFF
jgi:hypothetical protein